MKYKITKQDFDTVFDFAIRYHLDPTKSQSTRTSGASRGLGGVLDSFILGKLVELGVSNMLKSLNSNKSYDLDFDIKKNKDVLEEPDIVGVIENGKKREPNCFVEIKNVGRDDRWIGLHHEQFETIKRLSRPENIYIIGAHIENRNSGNTKQKDLLGIYLKNTFEHQSFSSFTDIDNIEIVADYAISGKELIEHGREYRKGSLMYETEIFEESSEKTAKSILDGKFEKIATLSRGILEKYPMDSKVPVPEFVGDIMVNGTIEVYEKMNKKSARRYVRCLTDVRMSCDALGVFDLEKGKVYLFNLHTVGRNPILNRNNIWIAKRSVPFLQSKKAIFTTEENLNQIAQKI